MKKEAGIFALLVFLCAVVAWRNPAFLSVTNLQNLGRIIGLYGIFSIGLGIVIITSGIDLSVGSVFALLGVVLSILLVEKHWPGPLAALAVVVGGAGLGWLHGLLVTRARLQPFVVTLCGLLFYRGLARFITGDQTKGFGASEGFETLKSAATGSFLGVPMPLVVLLVIAAVMSVALHRSTWGRYLYAVGKNEEAARYAGVNSRGVVASAYVISGLLAGIAGVLIAFYTNSVSPSSHGNFYELYGIAGAVLGGCSLRGGEGSIVGILIGTALLQVLQNLVNLLGIPSSLNFAVMGAVILLGVLADEAIKRRGALRARVAGA